MFKTDGSVHYGGVQNETDTIQLLNELNIYGSVVEKRGGTTQKADAATTDKLISIKRKKGIRNGSFDWFNTSKYNEYLGDVFNSFLDSVKEIRTLPKTIIEDGDFITKVRNQFNHLCETCLDNLTDSKIRIILQKGLCEANSNYDIVINDIETHKLSVFDFGSHPAVKCLNSHMNIFLEGSGKSSRKIIFTDGQNNYDCGLRIRVTSNNGINAFLGLSKANKNSQVVIKLQQDSIHKLLAQTEHKTYDY